jgi:hypothetical protein
VGLAVATTEPDVIEVLTTGSLLLSPPPPPPPPPHAVKAKSIIMAITVLKIFFISFLLFGYVHQVSSAERLK